MEPMIVVLPLGSALLGAALGLSLARWVAPWLGWALAAVLLGAAVVLVLSGQGRPGFDGLGQVVLAVLMAAPAGLGAALGTVIALARARHQGAGRHRDGPG